MTATRSSRLPLALACGGSFLAFLDVTITNLAAPSIAADFDIGTASLSWVVTLYTVLFAALLAPAGRLADVLGRGRLFAIGALAFTIASAAAAAAPTYGVLLGARAVQGAGAALLIPASLAFVLADTPPARRQAAIGLWSASAALAAAAGPALGGVLVDALDWRALFCINLPLGAWMAWQGLTLPAAMPSGRLPDVLGGALATAAVGLLVLGVTEGDGWGWDDPATLAALAGAVVAAAGALARAASHPSPAVEIGLWRSRTYAAANGVSLLFGAGLYASLLLGVLFLVQAWDLSQEHVLTVWVPTGLALGVGVGGVSVGVSTAAALSVAPQRFAAATGLNIAARQVGGALGVAVLAVMLDGRTPADGIDPFLDVYWFMAAVSLAAAIVALRLAPRPAPVAGIAGARLETDAVEA